ncbi:MAG: hypothetical protein IPO28_01665 [Holophagaceae bacterium]|nr:hypothetical protein [Holophagaceae bacterium]
MLTPAILGSLRIPASAAPSAPALANALAGQTIEATLEAVLPDGLVLRLADGKQLQAQGSLPFPPGSTLGLRGVPLPEGAGIRLQVVRATPPPSPALLAPLAFGEAAPLLARLQSSAAQTPLGQMLGQLLQAGLAVAEQPEVWSAWLKGSMEALADPGTSPAESAFHRLQAKEGTGWFEIPLPWAPGAEPLRLWIEGEGAPAGVDADAVHRVFLSVPFSSLGEVRLGLEQRSAGLRVRLWLQDPAQAEALGPDLEAELRSLGRPVDLQVLALPPDSPDLRALAGGSPLQAMG